MTVLGIDAVWEERQLPSILPPPASDPNGSNYDMELIEFSDGTVLNAQGIRDKTVADMKAPGATVLGSEFAEIYVHAMGDGSYTIRDHSYSSSTNDRLVLQGLAAGDVSFAQNAGKDLVITLANGETVTITDHFNGSNYDMELIEFSDGTVLNAQGIRDKTVADMKAPGATVLGSEFAETYVHAMGDGSYTIRDYSVRSGIVDQLIFADAMSTEAVIQRRASDPNDVVISFANGDHILLDDEVRSNKYYGVETILFTDGVSLSRADLMSAAIAADSLIFG